MQVWNPSNCEIWVLQRVSDGGGTYELRGRWRASPYGGSFVDVKFGVSKKESMYEHMKRPLVARRVTPGKPDALDSDELLDLRDLPGPVVGRAKRGPPGRNRAMQAGDAVLAYWGRDKQRADKQRAEPKPGAPAEKMGSSS